VKPDKAFETYQFSGNETGILAASYKYDEKGIMHSTEMEHVSVCGTVYAVPEKLKFYADDIWDLQDNNDFRQGTFVRQPYVQHKIDHLRSQSVQYNVPVEIEKGDKVYFEYLAYQLSEKILTNEGIMMLIKYDMLILALRDNECKMLNGFVLIENEKLEKQEVAGIELMLNQTEKKNRNRAKAKIISANAPCNKYLDFRGYQDGAAEQGDTILYDPRYAKELEYGLHRVFSDKKLLRIQRKDIYAVLDENTVNISYI
jgi:co-chaperonin GroES (HSP10)